MVSIKDYVQAEKKLLKTKIAFGNSKINKLNIIQVGNNSASNSYIKGKIKDCEELGIPVELHRFAESATTEDIKEKLISIGKQSAWNEKVIIQLPVPKHINLDVINGLYIMPEQDVDGFTMGSDYYPCTPRGIIEWLKYNKIDLTGKNVVIIGRSEIVGKPLAKLMCCKNATVTLCHSKTPYDKLVELCKLADIVVVAVGKRNWFSCDLPNKPIIIDVGINRDENNKLCGDVNYEYMEKQGCYVTPVPGGVGLLTRLALMKNILSIPMY